LLDAKNACAATQVKARWMNNIVKRAINGNYHPVKRVKYARRYLAKTAYRFIRQFYLAKMLSQLLREVVLCVHYMGLRLWLTSNFYG
jgi:hypothetical protein